MTVAEIDELLAELRELLATGVDSQTGPDGVSTKYRSADEIRRTINDLSEQRRRILGYSRRKRVFPSFGGGS